MPLGHALVLAALVALAGCSRPEDSRRADSGEARGTGGSATTSDTGEGGANAAHGPAFREVFDQVVPSIEAALPLAERVDSSLTGHNGDTFHATAWFSNHAPVALVVFLIQSGDTTSDERYYYQQGRLVAWTKRLHWLRTQVGWPHRMTAEATIGLDGHVTEVHARRDDREFPAASQLVTTLVRMSLDAAPGMLEILKAKAARPRG